MKDLIKILFSLLIFIFLYTACEKEELDVFFENVNYINDADKYYDVINGVSSGDEFELVSTERNQDELKVEVEFPGGCRDHSFDIITCCSECNDSSDVYNIIVRHNADNDSCTAVIKETLLINLRTVFGENYSDSAAVYVLNGYYYGNGK